ncbi:MAG: GNAT family N-acetyltransferase [Phycisphaerales bacterium]
MPREPTDLNIDALAHLMIESYRATILTHIRGVPLIAFSMTSPPWKRRGLARAGLVRVLRLLAARGEGAVDLIVTEGNDPAMALYRGLGFEIVETR